MKPREQRDETVRFRVRRANEFDREAWGHMRGDLWPEYSAEELAAETEAMLADDAKQAVFLALATDGELVGFAEFALRDHAEACASSPVGYVEGWYVIPSRRNEGIGRALLAAGESWARAKGCREMASDCYLDNLISRAAHNALGYAHAATLVHFKKEL